MPRPWQIKVAVGLMVLNLAYDLVDWFSPATRIDDYPIGQILLSVVIFLTALQVFFIVMVYKRRNWARLAIAGLTVVLYAGLGFLLRDFWGELSPELLVPICIDIVALYMLFVKPSSLWFRSRLN